MVYEDYMSFWQKLFAKEQHNGHKNHVACVENDCSCKSNEQLLAQLANATDEDVIIGTKKVLAARGFSRKELNELQQRPFQ